MPHNFFIEYDRNRNIFQVITDKDITDTTVVENEGTTQRETVTTTQTGASMNFMNSKN